MGYGWLAFLTDYGRRDGFVASCHGVIAQIAPDVRVIDITHDVPPQDIRHGAAVLAQTAPYLPPAVIVGVVDPGVGAERRGVAIAAGESLLVGPDNGLLLWVADALGGVSQAVVIESDAYLRRSGARTFDGRDVFAPAAAYLARGIDLSELGRAADDLARLPDPHIDAGDGRLTTEAIMVDHFGNVSLAATEADLIAAGLNHVDRVFVETGARTHRVTLGETFADVPRGRPVLYVDSAGHVAIAVNGGSAAAAFGLRPGDVAAIRERAP